MDNVQYEVETGTEGSARSGRRVIYLIVIALIAFSVWAANAPLEEIVRGEGRVVPTTNTQVVQNLEGGIVDAIFVVEGDVVEPKQLIAKMNETQFQSAYQELQEQSLALKLRLARLEVERDASADFIPDPELSELAKDYARSEVKLFEARKFDRISTLETLQNAADLKKREADILRPMVAKNAVAEIDLVKVEQAVVDAVGKVTAAENEFETARSQEYSETLVQLRQVEQQMRVREDQLFRTDVRSPVKGIVNKVLATTIGGVLSPGDPLVEILPMGEDLRIEGRIDPRDIGFVYAGMPASIKLTAFDFSVYGVMKGEVVHVGADTVIDEQARDAAPYYEVFVQVESTFLEGPDGLVEIRPGMLAQVELQSGEKTVLEYLLKPLFKTTEAFTER
jgi:adhesin transport system membrane fusion protein